MKAQGYEIIGTVTKPKDEQHILCKDKLGRKNRVYFEGAVPVTKLESASKLTHLPLTDDQRALWKQVLEAITKRTEDTAKEIEKLKENEP